MFNRIYIEITNICNLNCSFCKEDKRDKKYISVKDFNLIINQIKEFTDNVYLHIKGEPLMHPNINEIIDICNKSNINVNITTNGRLIKDNVNILSKVRQVNISLHSFNNNKDILNLFKIIENIDTKVSLRVWSNNKDILNLIEDYYKITKLNQKRNTIKNNLFLDIDNEFIWPDINLEKINETGTCYGLRRQIGILVDGTVVPCCLDQDGIINLGNIFNEKLIDILNKERSKTIKQNFQNNKLTEELCKRCSYINRFKD